MSIWNIFIHEHFWSKLQFNLIKLEYFMSSFTLLQYFLWHFILIECKKCFLWVFCSAFARSSCLDTLGTTYMFSRLKGTGIDLRTMGQHDVLGYMNFKVFRGGSLGNSHHHRLFVRLIASYGPSFFFVRRKLLGVIDEWQRI